MVTNQPDLSNETLKDRPDRGKGPVLATHEFLFVALEADRPLAGGARYSLTEVDEVVIGRGADRTAGRSNDGGVRRLTLRLPGKSLSGLHARLLRRGSGWTLEDAGSTNGCFVSGKRTQSAAIGPNDVIEVGHSFLLLRTVALPVDQAPPDLDSAQLDGELPGFATLVPALSARLAALTRIARSDVTVVLCGETGTGKELLARGLHKLSQRPGPFVAVNCGALTESLAESQLFGHVRGAFTGATADAVGFVRAADNGTLLLDEVGDLCRSGQAALLRVLQERDVVPVGSARAQKVEVRFVASSPWPLTQQVEGGAFRSDLFARLGGYLMTTVPLRERREDIGLLAAALLTKAGVRGGADGPRLTPEAALLLLQYDWPLNIRELEQSLRRAVALAGEQAIEPGHLVLEGVGAGKGAPALSPGRARVLSPEDSALRQSLIDALTATKGNVAEVVRQLGKARMQLHRWMRRFDIDPQSFRDP